MRPRNPSCDIFSHNEKTRFELTERSASCNQSKMQIPVITKIPNFLQNFVGVVEMFLIGLVTSLKQHNTLKGNTNTPAVDLLRLNSLRDTKTTFLIPKSYDGHP